MQIPDSNSPSSIMDSSAYIASTASATWQQDTSHVNDAIYMLTSLILMEMQTPHVLNMYTYISRPYVCISKASKTFLDSCVATVMSTTLSGT